MATTRPRAFNSPGLAWSVPLAEALWGLTFGALHKGHKAADFQGILAKSPNLSSPPLGNASRLQASPALPRNMPRPKRKGKSGRTKAARRPPKRALVVTGPRPVATFTLGAREVGGGRTQGGAVTKRWEFSQILVAITTTSGGTAVSHVALANTIFTRLAQLAAMYDRCRLISLRFHFAPMQGSQQPGQIIAYFDYRGTDADASTLAAASLFQGAQPGTVNAPLSIAWAKQDAIDEQFITTAQSPPVNFHNDALGHKLCWVIEGAGSAVTVYQLYAVGVVDFTARI